MDVKEQLIAETDKWLTKIAAERLSIELRDTQRPDFLRNMDAYISDAQHFLRTDDPIRAFEAVIWAWSLLELGLELGILARAK